MSIAVATGVLFHRTTTTTTAASSSSCSRYSCCLPTVVTPFHLLTVFVVNVVDPIGPPKETVDKSCSTWLHE